MQKYLKYKNKYSRLKLKLLGGKDCTNCPTRGFIQHSGECWHDSFSMIILFSNNISDDIQNKFNEWINLDSTNLLDQIDFIPKIIEDEIDKYLNSIFIDKTRDNLLPFNIEELTEKLKLNITQYIKYLFLRYKKELISINLISEQQNEIFRQVSSVSSLSCIDYLHDILSNNLVQKRNKKGGSISDLYIDKSLINYIFATDKIIQNISIEINSDIFKKSQQIIDLINKCDSMSISVEFDSTKSDSSHLVACIKCKDIQYLYDDNRGVDNGDYISIKKFNWKSQLIKYFSSEEEFKNLNSFLSKFSSYFDELHNKNIFNFTFYYKDNFDSDDYFFTTSLYKNYKNIRAKKLQKNQLINIVNNKNIYVQLNDNIVSNLIDFDIDPDLFLIILDKTDNFNVNNDNVLKYIILNKNDEIKHKLFKNPILNMENLKLWKLCFITNNVDLIIKIITHKNYDIKKNDPENGSFINYLIQNHSLNYISKKLITFGIDINTPNKSENKTSLDYCIEYNNKELFDLMIQIYTEKNYKININADVWNELKDLLQDENKDENIMTYYENIINETTKKIAEKDAEKNAEQIAEQIAKKIAEKDAEQIAEQIAEIDAEKNAEINKISSL